MTSFGPNLASSLAGAPQAERAAVQRSAREERDRAKTRRATEKDRDNPVDEVQLTEAVRNLKDNSQEETREDRQEHPQYGVAGRVIDRHRDGAKLDLEG